MTDPTLSVAMILGNEASDKLLDGVLRQQFKLADEVVIVYNSTDETPAVCRNVHQAMQGTPDLAQLVMVDRRGQHFDHAEQRNRALERCRGDWVLVTDGDEMWDPKLVKDWRRPLREHPEADAFVFPTYHLVRRPGGPLLWHKAGTKTSDAPWYPDYHVRLFKNSLALRFTDARLYRDPVVAYATRVRALHEIPLGFESEPVILDKLHLWHFGWCRAEAFMRAKVDGRNQEEVLAGWGAGDNNLDDDAWYDMQPFHKRFPDDWSNDLLDPRHPAPAQSLQAV